MRLVETIGGSKGTAHLYWSELDQCFIVEVKGEEVYRHNCVIEAQRWAIGTVF